MQKKPAYRLFIDHPLKMDERVELNKDQANYLLNVLRLQGGEAVAIFNGVDGEWLALVHKTGKRTAELQIDQLLKNQLPATDLQYLFAPLKRARLDYMIQKSVELGVSGLIPVLTQHTNVERVNLDRMRANAVEAAEQCGIMSLPFIHAPLKLERVIEEWDETRVIVFCDEGLAAGDDAGAKGPIGVLEQLRGQKIAVLIGPEGGFSSNERDLLSSKRFVKAISLGPRIMRADTAAVAALSLVNAVVGDWQSGL